MSERDEIIADIRDAFNNELADAVALVTITKYDTNEFDPTTGTVTQTVVNTQTVQGVFTGQWKYEVFNANIEPNDETLLILQDDLHFKPDIACMVSSTRGLTRIIEVRSDPMNVTWEFRVSY